MTISYGIPVPEHGHHPHIHSLSLSCCNKISQTNGGNYRNLVLTLLEAWKFKIKILQIWLLVRALFLVCRWLPCQCSLTWWREIIPLVPLVKGSQIPSQASGALQVCTTLGPKVNILMV
jgi:hypothetical protein